MVQQIINPGQVSAVTVGEDSAGQRIDNFLSKLLKGVPKSHVYRILRSGEVRVNSKRVDATYKLNLQDQVRIPPVRMKIASSQAVVSKAQSDRLDEAILLEDEAMLVLDKPAGIAVHGGSGISLGVIEQLRQSRPKAKFLELVHRLDRETSGVLLLAKKRSALIKLQAMIQSRETDKRYLMLVKGHWTDTKKQVRLPLHKFVAANGERRVTVSDDGQMSESWFYLQKAWASKQGQFSLLQAKLVTGKTHQLRVQLSHLGFPIVGDDKYGDFAFNKAMQKLGIKRMFLHAAELRLSHPVSGNKLHLSAPLPQHLQQFLDRLDNIQDVEKL